MIVWNNQNYMTYPNAIVMPFWNYGKSKPMPFLISLSERDVRLLNQATKLGTLKVTKKQNKWYAFISLEVETQTTTSEKVMGVDLGIKNPAVCVTEDGTVKFCGNGRQNKYFKRQYKHLRKKLGQSKKVKTIRKIHNKEQRYMKDQDHKISRKIVNFAISNNVGIIHLENLAGIRQTTRTSRKNNYSLHTWSFYRLAMYIEYKANLAGIKVKYVKPEYTSQTCPHCQVQNKSSDRKYQCKSCGHASHRDIVGARNIIFAPVLDGKSLAA